MKYIMDKLGKRIILPLTLLGFSYFSYSQNIEKDSLRTQKLKELIFLGDSVHVLQESISYLVESEEVEKLDSLLKIYNPMVEKFRSGVEKVIEEIMHSQNYNEYLKNKEVKEKNNETAKSESEIYL